jgi:predicted nuclease with TOPRIM domain
MSNELEANALTISALRDAVARLEHNAKLVGDENLRLKSRNDEVQSQIAELQSHNAELQSQNVELQSQNLGLQTQCLALQGQVAELIETVRGLRAEISSQRS